MNRKFWRWTRKLALPVAAIVLFWTLALLATRYTGSIRPLVLLGWLIGAIALSVTLYLRLPPQRRRMGRRLVFFVIGAGLFAISVTTQRNVQIEGLFFGLLAGVLQGAVIHYLLGKIGGPILFGRVWCGWACWIGMTLDLLPYKHGGGNFARPWTWLRYGHFALSLALVGIVWFGLGFHGGALGATAIIWFLLGNALYYVIAIGLAFALRDNRAFCKYVCPVTVPLKLMSRFALLKVKGDPARCDNDRACVAVCPMDIRINDYTKLGARVLSTECILCQDCINACNNRALSLSFGWDPRSLELYEPRQPARVGS